MSGEDAKLITAAPSHVDLGFVGNVSVVDPTMLERLVAEGLIPVVATIGADESGQAYNINADTVAGALAEALAAEKLVFLTDIEGLRVVADDPTTVIHQASLEVIDEIVRSGGAQGGMLPKVEACVRAVRAGVGRAHILDGRVPHALLLELFTEVGRRDDGAAVTGRGRRPLAARRSCARTPSRRRPSCAARAPSSTTPTARTTSTSSPGWRWCRSATPIRSWPTPWPSRRARCSHVSNLYGNTLAPEVARTIDRLINGGTGQAGGQVFFANSGAEANECALKLARRWAGDGRHVVISADNSFHGRTLATLTATGQPEKQAPFLPLPEGFVHVPYDDVAALDKALDPDTVAAVLLEPHPG